MSSLSEWRRQKELKSFNGNPIANAQCVFNPYPGIAGIRQVVAALARVRTNDQPDFHRLTTVATMYILPLLRSILSIKYQQFPEKKGDFH